MPLPQVRLRRDARARVLRGHPWVFSGELEALPPGLAAGDAVDLLDARGGFAGRGFITPAAVLALRILSRDPGEGLDGAFLAGRIAAAAARRRRDLPGEEALRLVAGEADGLPGLVADRYGAHVVVQATTAGMDRRLDAVTGALLALPGVSSVLARHDLPAREREGLVREVRQLSGTTPPEIEVAVGGLSVSVDPWEGQKTGFYLDQRDHYRLLAGRCEGRRVLDAFCYVGSWAVLAARAGAREALGVDSSGPALARARRHAVANGAPAARFEEANAFDWMRRASDRGERFDGIVLDPPPFVRRKEDLEAGISAYKELNLRALKMLSPGGWLYTASCSQRVGRDRFEDCLREAASDAGRSLRVLAATGQGRDHPVLLEVPETEYLKGLLLEAAA